LESCCSTRHRVSLERTKHTSKSNLSRSPSLRSQQGMSRCAQKSSRDRRSGGKDTCATVLKARCDIQSEGYSGGGLRNPQKSSCSGQGCCTVPENKEIPGKTCAEDSCSEMGCRPSTEGQEGRQYKPESDGISKARNFASNPSDVEKGLSMFEHVILSVQGMTCSGCETKLFRSLSGIPSAPSPPMMLSLNLKGRPGSVTRESRTKASI